MIKTKINQAENVELVQGEDKNLSFYLYDSESLEFVDLTPYSTISVCLKNEDETDLILNGVQTTTGKFEIDISVSESELLPVGTQKLQLELDTGAAKSIVLLSNDITVSSPYC
jgi:hypothetical protein